MALARLTAFFLLLCPALNQDAAWHESDLVGLSLLQRGASRLRTFAGLRYPQQDPAARTLLTLDTNHDGRIDPDEVAAFAHAQGLDAAVATQEFSSIDSNGDGVLDSTELKQVFGGSPSALAATEAAPEVLSTHAARVKLSAPKVAEEPPLPAPVVEPPVPTATEVLVAASVEAPAVAAVEAPTVAAVEVPVAATAEAYAGGAIEAPVVAAVEAPNVAAKAHDVTAVEAPTVAAKAIEAPLVAARAVETPPVDLLIISEESRSSLKNAARKVSEELGLEEKEEKVARNFDRKAAEARRKSAALVKLTDEDALDAGSKAAQLKADELIAKITKLQDQAEHAEVRAAALRAKSKMELEEGNQLMIAAQQALKQQQGS